VRTSTSVLGGGDSTHVVSFPDLSGADADRIVRAYVDAGTVRDTTTTTGGPLGPQQAVDVVGAGSVAGRPDLQSVTIDEAAGTVRYVFDEVVLLEPGGRFRVYSLGGTETVALASLVDGSSVVVDYSASGGTGDVQGASIDAGTVRSATSGLPNRVDEVGLARAFPAGRTAAPDLVSVGRTQGPGGVGVTVLFRFDQPVEFGTAGGFFLYDEAGARTALAGCALVEGDRVVRCAATGAAARATVGEGAVTDPSGRYVNPPSGRPL
jgi:hypothetical protein